MKASFVLPVRLDALRLRKVQTRNGTLVCLNMHDKRVVQSVKPVLVTDLLDTLVTDPFSRGMAAHFGFSTFDSFFAAKTPDVWVRFERGEIDENTLASTFFRDGRPIDVQSFKDFLRNSYELLPGIEDMLLSLQSAGIQMHICSNYPKWATIIEDKLQLAERFGLHWTFLSANEGIRKPEPEAYLRTASRAGVHAEQCVLLDDRKANCDGALRAGFLHAIRFQNAQQALAELADTFHPWVAL